MTGLEIPAQFLIAYFLIHFRFIGMVFTFPLFAMAAMPMPFRYLIAVILTMASAPAVNSAMASHAIPLIFFDSAIAITVVVLREFLIGALLGLLASLPLVALQVTGEKAGMSMALAMANFMDPATQQQTSLIGQFVFMVGIWFYFRWNGHLLMVQAIVESLRIVPLASMYLMPVTDMGIGQWLTSLFSIGVRMVLPFYGTILLADVGLGFLARTVPQMNIFVLGLPLKIGLGFFVLMVALPLMVEFIFDHMEPWIAFAIMSATAWR